ncbi:hypothetical protein Q9189_006634 [Teloschistes chrysophthalmus]
MPPLADTSARQPPSQESSLQVSNGPSIWDIARARLSLSLSRNESNSSSKIDNPAATGFSFYSRAPIDEETQNDTLFHVRHTHRYTSFLEIRGQPLVDLSLYLSSENYHASTRPAYSHILGWPTSWIIPPQRRAAAKTRTNNLDLSSLDLDSSKGNDVNSPEQGAAAEIPSSLRSALHKGSSTAKQAKHAARFRLDALTESFLEPLVQLLDGKRYLLSEDRITSLDCLALGYLSLALVPGLPIPWLSQLMKSRYPCLCHYVEDLARDCYGISIHSRDGMSRDKDMAMKLPCNGTDAPALPASVRGRGFLEQLPLVGPYYKPASLQQSTAKTHEELSAIPVIPTVFVGLVASLATMGGFIAYTGEVPSVMDSIWPLHRRNSQQRLNEMGEAGALLGAIDFRGASV